MHGVAKLALHVKASLDTPKQIAPGLRLFATIRRIFGHYASEDKRRNCHFRQKAGVSSTSTVKISMRPSNIAKVQIQVWKSFSEA
jgi:hypothetical protein